MGVRHGKTPGPNWPKTHLVGLFRDGDRSTDLGGTTTVHHTVIPDQVAHNADGIMQRTLSLVDDL